MNFDGILLAVREINAFCIVLDAIRSHKLWLQYDSGLACWSLGINWDRITDSFYFRVSVDLMIRME